MAVGNKFTIIDAPPRASTLKPYRTQFGIRLAEISRRKTTLSTPPAIYENCMKFRLLSMRWAALRLKGATSDLAELALRFAIGGIVVSAFSAIGSVLRPKTFAGLFGAAPSVALATLALTFHKNGHAYAAIEGRFMLLGALALAAYAWVAAMILFRARHNTLLVASLSLLVWVSVAFGLWALLLR